MTLYRETPCKHGRVGDCDAQTHGAGRYCPGGPREEVTIDYEAAYIVDAFRDGVPCSAEDLISTSLIHRIVDIALGEEE